MSNTLRKAQRTYRNEGGIQLIKKGVRFGYDHFIRPLLPRRTVSYNGVPVRAAHLGDNLIPWHEMDIPGYEDALVRGIRQHAKEGDSVVIVGGGWGISTVVAANQVGESGTVTTFEGSYEAAKKVTETASLNHIIDQVAIQHAIVAQALSLRGSEGGAKIISPEELPECEILVLDCEGAELSIIEEMSINPKTIIVETHGMFGASEAEVKQRLDTREYNILSTKVAEERFRTSCEEDGIYVLIAEHSSY